MAEPERVSCRTILAACLALLSVAGFSPAARAAEGVDFPEAVSRALRNNAGLTAAGFEWTAARKHAAAERANYLPRLTFEEQFVRTNVPAEAFALKLNQERLLASDFADVRNFNQPPPVNDFIALFTLEQPLFAPKAFLGYRMARREARATGLDVSRRQEEVVFRVLAAYLDVLTAGEHRRVAQRALSDAREHHKAAEAMERAGMGLASDVLRARVALASAEAAEVTAENRLALARIALALAMGEEGGEGVDAIGPVPPLPEIGSLEERIRAVAERRSDLQAFSLRLSNADARVALERSEYLPTVGVTGTYRIDGSDGPFSPDNRTWNVGVGLSWNLFDGLRREAAVAKAAAERAGAKAYFRGAADQAAFEVTEAYLSVDEARRRVEIARAAVALAEEGTRLIRARYENQLARFLDLLDAQTALDSARADLVRAENDLLQSRARLERASGTLLSWALPGPEGDEEKGRDR